MTLDPTAIVKPIADAASSSVLKETLSDAWQIVLGDRVAAWRLTNAAKIQAKTNARFAELGVKANIERIPERFAVTWFEEATKQDEDEIQDLFACLLANAATGDEDALDRRNLEIVGKLSPNDAALFLELGRGKWGATRLGQAMAWKEDGYLFGPPESKVNAASATRSFEHLVGIGLLSRTTIGEEKLNDRSLREPPRIQTIVKSYLYLNETGKSVYKAVTSTDAGWEKGLRSPSRS